MTQRGRVTKLCGICGEPSKDALPHRGCVEPHTLPALARIACIEYRTAHVWMKRGLLSPSIREAGGTGHPALFSSSDVCRAIRLARLREAGLSMDGLRRVVDD